MQENGVIRLSRFDYDSQWNEHSNRLILCDSRAVLCETDKDIDYIIIPCIMTVPPMQFKNQKFIVVSPGDLYGAKVGLRHLDEEYRNMHRQNGNRFIYLECEVEPQGQKLYQDDHFVILTMPMGYIAGSKMNVHYADNDDSAWHINHIFSNPKRYDYDWCWIGTDSSVERVDAVNLLEKRNDGYLVRQKPSKERDRMKRMKKIHADNKAVPYDKFMEIHRKSKVSISCNGMGMWCYKDAEMLARNCFVLRQHHRNLGLNPLSPKDGVHWVTFTNGELNEKLDYYIHNDEERERINDAGHEYFKEGILGGWAKHYVNALIIYKETEDKAVFGSLLYRG